MNRQNLDLIALSKQLGLHIPELYLPNQDIDLFNWPVVACDQYTSQPEYWQETERMVGKKPSTLRLILPELFLDFPGQTSVKQRIKAINANMETYLTQNILIKKEPGCVVLDRSTPIHKSRKGLVIAVDLDAYDFEPGNKELIRATEGTVLERIPPRQAIRRHAKLELPHVQLLIDDPAYSVIEPLWKHCAQDTPLYQTDLMQNGGHLTGWFVDKDSPQLKKAIEALAELDSYKSDNFLFAVGDGNHSLATAKAHWQEIRAHVSADHPARYALVEIINIHDQGLLFEPIHRVVFVKNTSAFFEQAQGWFDDFSKNISDTSSEAVEDVSLPIYVEGQEAQFTFRRPNNLLTVAIVQKMLDQLSENFRIKDPDCRIDYIHGENTVQELAAQEGRIGIVLPPFGKDSFFATISRDGILPRKTFSMGEAYEKRYYFESRLINSKR